MGRDLAVGVVVFPVELARADAVLDDSLFSAPFATYCAARTGRPSVPMQRYLRSMFLKFRYWLADDVTHRNWPRASNGLPAASNDHHVLTTGWFLGVVATLL